LQANKVAAALVSTAATMADQAVQEFERRFPGRLRDDEPRR
jgi:hypothetical protein